MSEATSLAPVASLEVVGPAKQGVRVEFRWTGDRFSHTIFSLRDGQAMPLIESIEGTPADRFPPSPALVELHRQDETIFLTGATEAGHWSMSVEPVLNPPPSQGGARGGPESPENFTKYFKQFLLFDVACRLRKEGGAVRSEYQSVSESVRCTQSEQGVRFNCDPEHIAFLAPMQQADCRSAYELQSQKTTLAPACDAPNVFPATIRWRYGVFIDPA